MPYDADEQHYSTVAEALQRETVDKLKKLVELLKTSERPTRKGELVALIARHLEGESLRALWSQLDQLQQAAVAEATYAPDGLFHADRFEAKYGGQPSWGSKNNRIYGYGENPSPLRLFIYGVVVPDDIKSRLKAFVPEPAKVTLNRIDEVAETFNLKSHRYNPKTKSYEAVEEGIPVVRRETERHALQELPTVLRLVEAGKIAVSDKTLRPTAASMQTLAEVLRGGDYYELPDKPAKKREYEEQEIGPIKAFAWPMIVQAAKLAELSGARLSLTKAGRKALSAPPAETLRLAWQRWLKTRILDELRRIDVIKGQTGAGKRGLTAVDERRAVIAKALAECPVGSWVSVNEFFRYMQAAEFDFEVTRDPWELYIVEQGYGSLGYDGFHEWRILQGRYALCLLFEYAATLGLIDVAYVPPMGARRDYTNLWGADDLEFFSRYDGLLYFRFTALGAYCLGITDTYTPTPLETRPSLSVLPSLKITVTGERLSPNEMLLLDAYAERVSDVVWHLDQARTMEAIENGHQVSELHEFLQARDEQPLPETVERFLADAEQRARLVQDRGTARLIECRDAELAALIAGDARTKRYCLRAGDRHLVVTLESEAQFRKALRSLGYAIPKV